jgi:hypothetical protein
MKYLYKYPQTEYPYKKLMEENLMRDREVPEYEILDTDVFEENRYWDIVIEVSSPSLPTLAPILLPPNSPSPLPSHGSPANSSTPRTMKMKRKR